MLRFQWRSLYKQIGLCQSFQQHTSHFLESRFRRSLVYFQKYFRKFPQRTQLRVPKGRFLGPSFWRGLQFSLGCHVMCSGSAEIWARRAVGMNFEENRPFWAVTGVTISRAQPTEHRKLMPGVPPGRGD